MNELALNSGDLMRALQRTHQRIGQLDLAPSQRTLTARNYASSIDALFIWMQRTGQHTPNKSALEQWRRDMLLEGVAVKTINARLSAVRKLLRSVADDSTDLYVKFILNDWAKVENAREEQIQDKTEKDYGVRLTLEELEAVIRSFDVSHIKGLRDRALVSLMAGAGLRVGEVVALTMEDVFDTYNESKQRAIHIRQGKYNKSRKVVMNSWNSWVIQAVKSYTDALKLDSMSAIVFRPVKFVKGGSWVSLNKTLSKRAAQDAVDAIAIVGYEKLAAHDFRRTYAKLCIKYGMTWEALRDNMGHSSVTITEAYVGKETDWTPRQPKWSIEL